MAIPMPLLILAAVAAPTASPPDAHDLKRPRGDVIEVREQPVRPPGAAATVRISFGSYAMGIDRAAAARIDAIAAADPAIQRISRSGYGREGEYILTLHAASRSDALRLTKRIVRALPAKPRGPITVEGPGGTISAPRR